MAEKTYGSKGFLCRLTSFLLIFAFVLSACACGADDTSSREESTPSLSASTSRTAQTTLRTAALTAVETSAATTAQTTTTTASTTTTAATTTAATTTAQTTTTATSSATETTVNAENTSALATESSNEPVITTTSSAPAQTYGKSDLPLYAPPVNDVVKYSKDGMTISNSDFVMSAELENEFLTLFKSYPLSESVTLRDLSNNMVFNYNENNYLLTASSIKAPYGLFVSKLFQEGKLDESVKVEYLEKYYKPNGTGAVQEFDFGTPFSVKRLWELMIMVSDNIAYFMLKAQAGYAGFNAMLNSMGCRSILSGGSDWGSISAHDMAEVWREIYYYSQSTERGQQYLDLLKQARYNYIKRNLPEYESIHKSGWGVRSYNDAGIVYNEGPYVLVVLTERRDVYDEDATAYFDKIVKLLGKLMDEHNAYAG